MNNGPSDASGFRSIKSNACRKFIRPRQYRVTLSNGMTALKDFVVETCHDNIVISPVMPFNDFAYKQDPSSIILTNAVIRTWFSIKNYGDSNILLNSNCPIKSINLYSDLSCTIPLTDPSISEDG